MSATPSLFEYRGSDESLSKDDLFFERLETFMEKSLSDIKAFADRESQPYEETRKYVAQWHAKSLLLPAVTPLLSESPQSPSRLSHIRSVLCDASKVLENLSTTSGVQSFLLAVDPFDPLDSGFLGGSLLGREFWRGLRGGGETGARSFRTHCMAQLQSKNIQKDDGSTPPAEPQPPLPPTPKAHHAKSLKNELYESVRHALRSISGVRTAEMKWTNPEKLDTYGVRLLGWPEGVPAQNPSSLKSGQNKLLLEALQNGTMRFERLSYGSPAPVSKKLGKEEGFGDTEDFSWAYDADAAPPSPVQESSILTTTEPAEVNRTPLPVTSSQGFQQSEVWNLNDDDIDNNAPYSIDYSWGVDLHDSTSLLDVWEGANGEYLESGRPRKRSRSEEPPSAEKDRSSK